jgi:hypothetical protein
MSSFTGTKHDVGRAAGQVAPWIEALARLGYAAKGIVYGLIGILALQSVIGTGSPNVNQVTAFQKILQQPFGKFLLWIVVIGLIGYALWRLLQSVLDPEYEGKQKTGVLKRVGYFVSGVTYLALAYIAYQMVQGKSSGSGGSTSDITAKVMHMPGGQIIVGILGLIILGVGLYAIYSAFQRTFEKRFQYSRMSATERRWALRLGRMGYAARGVVFSLVGLFLIEAAYSYNPAKANGLGGALQALASTPYGPWLLGLVSIGLIAFGVYCLALARYRQININFE